MLLHGIYENGRIKILDKKLPKVKKEIEIEIPELDDGLNIKIDFIKNDLYGLWENRRDIKNSLNYVHKIRRKWKTNFYGND